MISATGPQTAPQPLAGEPPAIAVGSPLPSASSFRCPCRSTPGPAILNFKRSAFTPFPTAVTKVAQTTFAPAKRYSIQWRGQTPACPPCADRPQPCSSSPSLRHPFTGQGGLARWSGRRVGAALQGRHSRGKPFWRPTAVSPSCPVSTGSFSAARRSPHPDYRKRPPSRRKGASHRL